MASQQQQQSAAQQKPLQQDWANREYMEVITGSIKKISDFLNSFDTSCRSRLATLNQKLTELERRVEYIEARVANYEPEKDASIEEGDIASQNAND